MLQNYIKFLDYPTLIIMYKFEGISFPDLLCFLKKKEYLCPVISSCANGSIIF